MAFYARLAYEEEFTVLENSILIFDDIEVNLGNGYSTASGSFTTFTAGYYVFTLFFQTNLSVDSDLAIMVNDEAVCSGSGATSWQQGTCTAAVELNVGDVVNVKALTHDAVLFGGSAGKINE